MLVNGIAATTGSCSIISRFAGFLLFFMAALPAPSLAQMVNRPTTEVQTLFSDDFSSALTFDKWNFNQFASGGSFYGRTQQRQNLPQVANGQLLLQLDTYNPTPPGTGNSFLGSEIISVPTFVNSAGGIAFEASMRVASPVAGVVGAVFGYNFSNATMLDNELDDELLGNDAAAGINQEQTNVYANEPLGPGHPQFVPVTDLTTFHTYRMEWFPDRVRWLIDGQLVREDTVHIPLGALALHLNIWAPDQNWAQAFSASLQPAANQNANVSYYVDVDFARVAQLGFYTPVLCCRDLNGDGKADILWRNGNGTLDEWCLSTAGRIAEGSPGTVGNDWTIVGLGDFNGDGKADILWRNVNTGEVYLWLMNGATILSQGSLGAVGTDWQIAGIGDFNHDGKADILWRHTSGAVYVWLINGLGVIGEGAAGSATPDWQIASVGDFDGDGTADILWRNTVSGEVYLWLMNGIASSSQGSPGNATLDWQIAGVGDFDGDGKADILWRNTVSGEVYLWLMNGTATRSQGSPGSATLDWQIAGVGDFNGDGKADILWRNASGEVYEWLMNGIISISQGSPGAAASDWQIE